METQQWVAGSVLFTYHAHGDSEFSKHSRLSPELSSERKRNVQKYHSLKKKSDLGQTQLEKSQSPAVFRIYPILVTLWFCNNNIKCDFRGVFPFNSLTPKCLLFKPYVSSLCTLNIFKMSFCKSYLMFKKAFWLLLESRNDL